MGRVGRLRARVFLQDVLLLSLSAFGGPQAHIALMLDQLVERRKYVTAEELLELNALCQLLPGPTSTQTITAIGFKLGGYSLAWLTLLVWAFPACLMMTMIALMMGYVQGFGFELRLLRFLGPIAVGFTSVAAVRLFRASVHSRLEWGIALGSLFVCLGLTNSITFPAVLLLGGLVSMMVDRKPLEKQEYGFGGIQWRYFVLYAGVLLLAVVLGNVYRDRWILLFENLYRYGSLVFGGGHSLFPMMFEQFVEVKKYLSPAEFLSGLGLAQAIPGPVFSFAAFVGAGAFSDAGFPSMLLGALVGSLAIFLPGTLLIFFIYPGWDDLKKNRGVRRSLSGVHAAAAGLIAASAVILLRPLGFQSLNLMVVALSFFGMYALHIPPILLVSMGIVAGVVWA